MRAAPRAGNRPRNDPGKCPGHCRPTPRWQPARRSLRQFDLRQRLFRYPCSYLIYSEAFAGLPDEVRSQIIDKLFAVLKNQETPEGFEHLDAETRDNILDILVDTMPEFRQQLAGEYLPNAAQP